MTLTILALLLAAGLPVPPQASQLPPWYRWLFEAFRPAGGGSGTILTVTGVSPLLLVNSLAHSIASLTQYGKCVQDGTPTPDAPVDIMCNNGALRYSANMANVNEQTARVGYYINAQGAVLADIYNWFYQAYIPVKPNTAYTLSMSQSVYYVSISEYSTPEDSGFIIRKTGTTGSNTSLTITTGANTNFLRFGTNLDRGVVTLERVLAINWMLNIGTAMDYQPYVEGGIYAGGTHPGQNLVDLTAVTDGYYYNQSGVYTAVSDARLTDYIPVRAGQKYTAYVANRGSEFAFNVRANLFGADRVWLSQSATPVNQPSVIVITPTEDGYLRLSANYKGTSSTSSWADWSTLQIVRGEYTVATMPPYEPYTEVPYTPEVLTVSADGAETQTVTDIPMLLSVGDYKDEGEIISGIKTGKVGIKVYTGEETFNRTTVNQCYTDVAPFGVISSLTNRRLVCTHFSSADSLPEQGSRQGVCIIGKNGANCHVAFGATVDYPSIDAFKAWLAAQYAAGTPVIVLYPLATETTEQTTPHSLHSYNGTTVVDVTSPVDPVELRAEYKGMAT